MLKNILRILVSLAFLGLLAYMMREDIPEIINTLQNAQALQILLAIVIFTVGVLIMSLRLQLIFDLQKTPLGYWQAVDVTYIGYFFNNFLPTAIGGDLVKAYCAGRISGARLKSFTGVLMDRIFGLMMFVMIPTATILFLAKDLDPRVPMMIFAVFLIAAASAVLIFNRGVARKFKFVLHPLKLIKLYDKFHEIYTHMNDFKSHKFDLLKIMFYSLAGQLCMITGVLFMIKALSSHMNILKVFLLTPVVNLMSMMPSINGLGIRETAFVYFFEGSIGKSNAAALAILYLFLLVVQSVIGAVRYIMRPDLHFRLQDLKRESKAVS